MGWSSGSGLFNEVIEILKDKVDDVLVREEIYDGLIPLFEDYDCDTLDECLGKDIAFDLIFKKYQKRDDEDWLPEDEEDGWPSDER